MTSTQDNNILPQKLFVSSPSSSLFTSFESLPNLPVILSYTQCVWSVDGKELLICGGERNGNCYSYHIDKKKYKWVADYPPEVSNSLWGHVVIVCESIDGFVETPSNFPFPVKDNKQEDQKNITTLLSFGGKSEHEDKYTLIMRYKSVWNDDNDDDNDDDDDDNNNNNKEKNQWIIIKNIFEKMREDLNHVRALVYTGKNNNPLLFMMYLFNYIEVFDLKSCTIIAHHTLPDNFYSGCCFVKTGTINDPIIMFYKRVGLSIQYDEKNSTFEYQTLPVYPEFHAVNNYSYILWKDFIVLFGGYNCETADSLNDIGVYSIKKKKWYKHIYIKLPSNCRSSFAILDTNHNWVHIIGGKDYDKVLNQHWRIHLRELIGFTYEEVEIIIEYWIQKNNIKIGWIKEFYSIIINYLNLISISQ